MRTAAAFLAPQNAGDVAVEAATAIPMPLPWRVALASAGLLLGDPNEAQAGPVDRIARRAATAAARGAEAAEVGVARARREGWGGRIEAAPRTTGEGGEAARRPGIGHNQPPPGPMPREEEVAAAALPAAPPRGTGLRLPINPAALRDDRGGPPVPAAPADGEEALFAGRPEAGTPSPLPPPPHTPTPEEEAMVAAILNPRRMNTDQEGRPITAPYRSGRLEDGSYLAMPPQDIEAVARLLAGRGVRIRPAAEFQDHVLGVASLRVPDQRSLANLDPLERAQAIRDRIQIRIREGEPVGGETVAHEIGHPIHMQMPRFRPDLPAQARSELARLYRGHIPYSPESLTYDKELFANAVSAYLRNPRWINEQAPAAAAYLRSVVNTHPFLSRILGLNSAAPAGLLGAGTAAGLLGGDPPSTEP
ncbi:hypothetical protein GXW71_32645 [Roseomonas hellenica]|uniref:Uncharacterized protein n=1 Tax=Plastoroseomonas hellenica TaxID=2687306 RepID=A0ABS5F9C4_9PROT|nr:hypothetical protein [Plastoroseomonas hellenica]MBR0669145.1 hypothetical protein [Plastoroseomonas hellenica]